ncbi:MAG: glycosyl transferase family 2 [Halanaerobium sp. 4-GBenrich]|jgi:esterase/lipase|uniref:Esterase/lipase n=2 Tax=Halanaerobium congolense TaxID=54121 RepID=A0A1M7JVU5_9FIRM|nr:glycosyltransferase [Halanaerobium congolense]ODS49735.1 MAG: glycosyl transferase family 2 [Halanaerobium sp. 4-GBenrich]TDS31532.1 esterase/lipase [Halanaerobium congolense]TDX37807.1 esterase/lipase [Halanaerobium congolense]SDH51417.1 Esterase/lipase [Halanaerobium congolense]SDI33403.1 Esterase/lipase [Halanaerobium congolense]
MINIELKNDSKALFFLIHGYTGSPTDFNGLPEYLSNTLAVNVKVMLLKGHGRTVQALDNIGLKDFINQIEAELKSDLKKYDEIILGGVSFGAQMALHFASKFPVDGVFNVCLPYKLKFPFNIPGLSLLGFFKKYWTKPLPDEEEKIRQNTFYYNQMHANGLKIIKKANNLLEKELSKITCPVFTIHSKNDPIGNYKAIGYISRKIEAPHYIEIIDNKNHNLFFSKKSSEIYKNITDFYQNINKEKNKNEDTTAAIIPAYNEAQNIDRVLDVLTQAEFLNEIIVIDDGSTDNTAEVVSRFERVKLIKNDTNRGKAQSMQQGVENTEADILFFCDADLKDLTVEIVAQIIQPVAKRKYDMYIGVRNNFMQKAVTLFALNSGERAVRRELWNELPEHFKYRYRVEAGLNFIAKRRGNGYGWEKFEYYQTLKEKKYGFLKGTLLRWWMNLDVAYAYLLTIFQRLKR